MASYPRSFNIPCVGNSKCNNNFNVCGKQNVILNNTVYKEQISRSNIPLSVINNPAESYTTHCQAYGYDVSDSNNTVKSTAPHSWTNIRGYGHLVISNEDLNVPEGIKVNGIVSNYNRLPPMSLPYDGPGNIKNTWSNKPYA